ncbi:MAG: aminotransferase class IV [Planctomycetota bacterium]
MGRDPIANWNGTIMPLREVRVSVLDRAFLFGDAVYEALNIYSGRYWLFREHMSRLRKSLAELRIQCDVDRLESRMIETLSASGVSHGIVYLQITRGEAPRTHYFPKTPVSPNELIWITDTGADPYAHLRPDGVACITHEDLRWARRDIKSVNLLGNVLGCQAAVEAGCFEAILVEPNGLISEGTHTSVFAVRQGRLLTAPQSHHILPGITRGLVLQLAEHADIPIEEHAVHISDLPELEEMFLTGTSTEVLAIVKVDGKPIGAGKPGPITRKLHETYRSAVERWLAAEVST